MALAMNKLVTITLLGVLGTSATENDYYKLTTVPFPKELKLEVSGMAALSGDRMAGVWYADATEAMKHQHSMDVVAFGQFEAMAVSPLASGRLATPDICLIYATPAQMILFINGLQWTGYRKLEWGCVGESACADSWGRALKTGEPSLSIPCFAERRYGGVLEDELLMAIPPQFLPKVIAGLEALSNNGLRYPIPQYGINNDVRAGMGISYTTG